MEQEQKYTVEEAHRRFAVNCFNQIWPLLEKTDRTEEQDQEMIRLAHTSHYHWLQVGKPINDQRGEWMLARVYTILENKVKSLHHAKRCLALTEEYGFDDFDLGYAYEAMARAHALNQHKAEFKKYHNLASDAGDQIKKKEDRELYISDLAKAPWFGFS